MMRYLLAVWLVLFLMIVAVASPQADADAALALASASIKVDEPVKPALPTDPNQPAPSGYQWQSRNGGPWKLVKVSEVTSPSPFLYTTPDTTVRRVAVPSSSWQASIVTGRTIIGVGMMAQRGGIDCPPSG